MKKVKKRKKHNRNEKQQITNREVKKESFVDKPEIKQFLIVLEARVMEATLS